MIGLADTLVVLPFLHLDHSSRRTDNFLRFLVRSPRLAQSFIPPHRSA
jgi:hypothetical protein